MALSFQDYQKIFSGDKIAVGSTSKHQFFEGGLFSDVVDAVSIGNYAIGGIISGKGAIEGVKQRIYPSDALDIKNPFLAFAVDVALDPLTYTGIGASTKIMGLTKFAKGASKAATIANVTKGGKVTKAVAQQLLERGALTKGATLAEQASLGQRAFLTLDVPFIKSLQGIPLIKGERLLTGMTRLTETTKQISKKYGLGIDKLGERLGGRPALSQIGGVSGAWKGDIGALNSRANRAQASMAKLKQAKIAQRGEQALTEEMIVKMQRDFESAVKTSKVSTVNASKAILRFIEGSTKTVPKGLEEVAQGMKNLSEELGVRWERAGGSILEGKSLPNLLIKEAEAELQGFTLGGRIHGGKNPSDKTAQFVNFKNMEGKFFGGKTLSRSKGATLQNGLGLIEFEKGLYMPKKVFDAIKARGGQLAKKIEGLEYLAENAPDAASRKAAKDALDPLKAVSDALTIENVKTVAPDQVYKRVGTGVEESEAIMKSFRKGKGEFEKDPFKLLRVKSQRVAKKQASAQFLNDMKKFGKKLKKDAELPDGMARSTHEALKGYMFEEEIISHVDELYTSFTGLKEVGRFVEGYDKVLNLWKGSATFANMAFHTRNFVSNMWQLHLARAYDPKAYGMAMDVMWKAKTEAYTTGKNLMEVLTPKQRKLYTEFVSQALGGTGAFTADFTGFAAKAQNNPLFKGGRWLGTGIEDMAKFTLYVDRRAKGYSVMEAAEDVRKYLFDYGDLTEFEKTWMKRAFPFYTWCVPDDSEALTRNGWKFQHQIHIGDEILTYNIEKDLFEWQPVKEKGVFDYNGHLMHSRSAEVNFEFTPNHRWVIEDHNKERKIVKGYELRSNHKFILTADYEAEGSILTEKEAAVLGWIVTDGYHRWKGGSFEAMIYQLKKPYVEEIRELLGDWLSSESVHPDSKTICFRIKTLKLTNIKKLFKSKKDLPYIVANLGTKELQVYWDVCMKAKGHVDFKQMHFAQNPGPVLDSFQIATLLLGKTCNLSNRGCYMKSKKRMKVHNTLGTNWYSGKVWCPVVDNGTWLMRRHGKPVITGNSKKNIPLQVSMLIQNPSKFGDLGRFKHAIEKNAEGQPMDDKYMPEWLEEAFPVYLGVDSTGMKRYIKAEGFLPAVDINQIGRMAKGEFFLEQFTPLIKTPLEMIANYSIFYENEISGYAGQKNRMLGGHLPAKVEYALKQIRPINELSKALGGGDQKKIASAKERFWSWFIGKQYTLDVRTQRQVFDYVQAMQESQVKKDIDVARSKGETGEIRRLNEYLKEVRSGKHIHL